MPHLFSISAMFILFRETLEACIIVSVMLQLCVKLNLLKLRKWGESAPRSGALHSQDKACHITAPTGTDMCICCTFDSTPI